MTHGQKEEILFEESKEFLELIDQCKKQNSDALERFFELYSIDIYNFPIKVFQFSEEEAGDFFLFAFERLRDGKRFKTFRGESSFKTWFYSVLRNLVVDWIRANKKSKILQFYHYGSLTEVENEIFDELKSEDQIELNQIKNLFYQTIDSLDEESRIIFKLVYIFYLNLDERDIQILKDKYHKSGYEIFKFVLETKEYLVNKNLKLNQKKERLYRIYLNLVKLKEKEKELKRFSQSPFLEELQNKINQKTITRNKMIQHQNPETIVIKTPFDKIGTFLGISTPTVSSIYRKTIKKIKNSQELKKIFTE